MSDALTLNYREPLRRGDFYVERSADRIVRELLEQGELCHLLAPHKTGKSTLAHRVKRHLEERGFLTAYIDLNGRIFTNCRAEDFYFDIFGDIQHQLRIDKDDYRAWWPGKLPSQPWQEFLEGFLLPRVPVHVLVFIDELDDLAKVTFGEDFLLQLRALHNARARSDPLQRITFCLIGTLPGEVFISDTRRTAFNIGQRVLLADFSEEQVAEFEPLLASITSKPGKALSEVYALTGGHPWMLQRMLVELLKGEPLKLIRVRDRVTQLAAQFLSPAASESVSRIGTRILSATTLAPPRQKLRLYGAVLNAEDGLDYRSSDPVHLDLLLAGAVTVDQRDDGAYLVVRNQIVADHFNDEWVQGQFLQLRLGGPATGAGSRALGEPETALCRVTALVDRLFCEDDDAQTAPYSRPANQLGTELIANTLYLYRLDAVESKERVALQVFLGIEGLGGQLWEQAVRALLRINSHRHDALPIILDGGYRSVGHDAGRGAGPGQDVAYIVTNAGSRSLAEPGAMELFREEKSLALQQLNILAEGLATLHRLGLMHRNLHPGTIDLVSRDAEGGDVYLRMSRFEMAPLIGNLLRRLDPAARPDDDDSDFRGEEAEQIRSYFLNQRVDALCCLSPERLAHLFGRARGALYEGPNSDVFSLGIIAYQWFVGQLPRRHVEATFGPHGYAPDAWEELHRAMLVQIAKSKLPEKLRELIERMLAPKPKDRLESWQVVNLLVEHFDTIARPWRKNMQGQRYLVTYLPDDMGAFLYAHDLVRRDPKSEVGRAEVYRFLVRDLANTTLSFSPPGCAALVADPGPDQEKARYVLNGTRLLYFCHLYEQRRLPNQPAHLVPQALLIRYSVEASKAHHLDPNAERRQVPPIEVASSASGVLDFDRLTQRPIWKPLLESVERVAQSPTQTRFLSALAWLLMLNETRLDARIYPVEVDRDDPTVLKLERERERDWMLSTDLRGLYYSDGDLRPGFADFFEQEALKKGNLELKLVPSIGGRPEFGPGGQQLWFLERAGRDAIRISYDTSDRGGPRRLQGNWWVQLADDDGTRFQLRQQRRSLHMLRGMPELVVQLQHPSTPTRIRQRWSQAGVGLEGRAPEIIRKLLDSRPIFALQGPPGTGKTTVIAEAVQQCLDRDRNARILIAAQSHYALDNLAERVHLKLAKTGLSGVDAVRIVSPKSKDREFPEIVQRYFIETRVEESKRAILRHCDEQLEALPPQAESGATGSSPGGAAFSTKELLGRWRRVVESGEAELHDRLRRGANLVYCTTGTATDAYLGTDREDSFDWVIVDEAAKAWPTELIMPLVYGQRWALVGDHRQLGAFGRLEVQRVLEKCSTSNLEGLREMGRLSEELFQAFELFEHLIEGGSADETGFLRRPVERLTEQFRMHPAISELISRCFYGGELQSAESTKERLHGLRSPTWLRDRALIWVDTGSAHEAPESPQERWHNPHEARLVATIVDKLGPTASKAVVLSPYNAQLKKLRNLVPSAFKDRLYTVDAFQGRESDIVIVSMVRCNEARPSETIKRLGFMVEPERVNVLFSRARELLIIVGSFDQFYKSESPFWPKLCSQVMTDASSARVSAYDVLNAEADAAQAEDAR
jgi:hypothetical protein